jgi:hypothetical protein
MPTYSGATLAAFDRLKRRTKRHSIHDTLAAIEAANLPADLVPVKVAQAATGATRSFFARAIRRGDIQAFSVGPRLLISLSTAVKTVQALPRNSR